MKVEMVTKTFEIEGTELVICKSDDDWEIVGGYKNSINLEESYTASNVPEHFKRLFELNENEKLCDTIVCVEVEENIFDFNI